MIAAPATPEVRLSLGVTGHREDNRAFRDNREPIAAALREVFDAIEAAQAALPSIGVSVARARLHTLLADGVDQLAAEAALERGWELVAPLPFGYRLNAAINARPGSLADARALLRGGRAADSVADTRAERILSLGGKARLFELAERDADVAEMLLTTLEHPADHLHAQRFAAQVSRRVALAARVMIEQSDLIVAIWDGLSREFVGGTGHTIAQALNCSCPVVWIDARAPQGWRVLQAPESLTSSAGPVTPSRDAELAAVIHQAISLAEADDAASAASLAAEPWRPHSHPLSHAYRRMEALFGGGGRPFRRLRQTYESPDAVGEGSGAEVLAAVRALPGADTALPEAIESKVLRRFAWSDAVSARLSDVYRGGMTANFVLSAAAILPGVLYLPFVGSDQGPRAAAELALLAVILGITTVGQRRRWHGRWFETRRLAEYLRHSPILLALGVARAPGRWLRGSETTWPEAYARQALREVGLPAVAVTHAYLRIVLERLLEPHVARQGRYHAAKSARLNAVHRGLDKVSQAAFILAVIAVGGFLVLDVAEAVRLAPPESLKNGSKWFALVGVALPALGAAIAGIRYFGDFERFAAISEITAEKLEAVGRRIGLLLAGPDAGLDYERVADLAHEADDIVVTEIERWQSVFGSKHVTMPT